MASLRQEHHYGLSCGKNKKTSSNRTLYHVKLTDTAIRALEAFQNLKGSLPSEPSICFKGNQGYIKIPAPTAESPSALRVFSFYLSSDSKDQPQASFDCIHQYVSCDGREQLEGQGIIQDKITVCATDDSYQMTRERMSQVEKDIWSRSAIEIKPGATHPSKCVKVHKRPAPLSASDSSVYKQSTNNRRNGSTATPTQKSLKERIIHLLALKPYRKPELLLWLERERATPKDKAELGAILEEVCVNNVLRSMEKYGI
ncbi:RNA polymerase II elongation factor ELL2-like isoform X1 [Micropterus dolomieu]|uniref:RNA polymerase II elongation factor ELL2-like isoform X1 n=1 Tax=Micropterus dolomieu TaxID=147949 RepID=UPI001E8D35F4|nr:RNA polymerase II elongation factor ELL2-like isoform X1 [Micropterus dolomieu]